MSDEYCNKCKSKLATCPTCNGKGMVVEFGILTHSDKSCPNCRGTGKLCPQHGNNWG
jgi:DnaJ-class molecular chaperone